MKKIMKKVLSLALVVALAIAPMTVMAAGTTLNTDGLTSNVAEYDGTDLFVFDWTAEDKGVMTIQVDPSVTNWVLQVYEKDSYMPFSEGSSSSGSNTYQFQIDAAGDYEIKVGTLDWSAGTISFTASYVEGASLPGKSEDNPLDVTSTMSNNGVAAGTTVYYVISAEPFTTYTLTVNAMGMGMPMFNVFPMGSTTPAQGNSVEVTSNPLGKVMFSVVDSNFFGNWTYQFQLQETVSTPQVGTQDAPEEITTLGNMTSNCATIYWYKWTATGTGVFTVAAADGVTDEYSLSIWSVNSDTEVTKSDDGRSVEVYTGDVVVFYARNFENSTLDIVTSFEEGATLQPSGGNPGGGNLGGGTEVNYEMSATVLEVGTNEYNTSNMYTYTVYSFEPTQEGKYTISSTDSSVAMVSNNGMWITVGDSTDAITPSTVTANSFVWECTGQGQSIWVAAMPNTNVATITVSREELDKSDEVEWTVYKNKITPTTYKYDGDVDKLLETFVDTADKVVDKAVLGKDGYYHLNSENGEILYVNLNDSLMSLVTMATKGKISAVYYDKDNKVTEKIDFTTALLEYLGVKDIAELEALQLGTKPVIYPLTADLMTMFQKVGETNGWYGEGGFIADTLAEDAWMFACYYVKGQTTSSTPAPGQTSGAAGGATQAPNTGDNANVAVWAIVMVVAAGAAFVVAESKRRAR